MATLIFDIETVGEDWDSFDEITKHTLTRWIENSGRSSTEKEVWLMDIKSKLGFSPLTGRVVAVGVYDLERNQGAIYYSGTGEEVDEAVGEYVLKQRTETEMLNDFWTGSLEYDTFVSFNGRVFDLPFLIHRSVACGVKPRVDMLNQRYLSRQYRPWHVDLFDQLTFYGSMSRRPGLHLFCRSYGLISPKTKDLSGDDVSKLYNKGMYRDIAMYNRGDVMATCDLYRTWLAYLAPDYFFKRYEN